MNNSRLDEVGALLVPIAVLIGSAGASHSESRSALQFTTVLGATILVVMLIGALPFYRMRLFTGLLTSLALLLLGPASQAATGNDVFQGVFGFLTLVVGGVGTVGFLFFIVREIHAGG